MRVIHFTQGAGDSLWGNGSRGVSFVPLLEGDAATYVGCLHLSSGAVLDETALESTYALLIVQGRATLRDPCCIRLSGGMGIVMQPGERFRLDSSCGAIILLVECPDLEATEIAISTPQRIMGQRWPGEEMGSERDDP
jgi:hypothetical protein